jgi:hypothetical protein
MQIHPESIDIERRVVWRIQMQTHHVADASWYQPGNAVARITGAPRRRLSAAMYG